MTAFAYSTGTPTNIASANTATMADVKNSFADIATYVNGNNLDATYMAAGPVYPFRVLQSYSVNVQDGDLNPAYPKHFLGQGIYFAPAAVAPYSPTAPLGIQFDPADYTLTGKTLNLRLLVSMTFSTVIPSGDFTVGLYPLSSFTTSGGQFSPTLGTATASITQTPVAQTTFTSSTTFGPPVAGAYVFGAPGVTLPANCMFNVTIRLETHYV